MTQSADRRNALAARIFGAPAPTESPLVEAVGILADEAVRREAEKRDAPRAGSFDQGARGSVDKPLDPGAEMNASIREAAQRHSGALGRAERVNVAKEEK